MMLHICIGFIVMLAWQQRAYADEAHREKLLDTTAQEQNASSRPTSTVSQKIKAWFQEFEIHGYADVYYNYNFNRPVDGNNFVSGTGTSAKKANTFNLNLAALEFVHAPDPVGIHLVFNYGTGSEVLYASEPQGTAIGPQVYKFIQQASISYLIPVGRGLLIEGGIYPSHIGFEVFPSKDNWSYTRTWMGEFSPYYQAGLKLTYHFTDQLSAQLHVLNGWQLIGDNNEAKSLGSQLTWNHDKVSLIFNTFFGPELANDNTHWRLFGNFVSIVRPFSWLHFAACADVGYQQLPNQQSATWHTVYGNVRLMPLKWFATTLRAGYYSDASGFISGISQMLAQADVTLEFRPYDHIIIKSEGRYDHSTADVFSTAHKSDDGEVLKTKQQGLISLGVVAYF